jgi:F0F1-type ATP synthase epsilon subunit
MEISIISPVMQRTVTVEWIEVNTPTGNLVIQPGHAPLITMLSARQVCILGLPNGKQESFITGGILKVDRNKALLIHQE